MAYTYDDFVSAAESSGLLSQFSQYDLDLARQHPEFGLSILTLKQDWGKAANDEAKALINAKANELRKSYGNYTAGADGSGYVAGDLSPSSYQSAYGDDEAALLDKMVNREEFSYNKDEDPSYSAYKKEYLREGQRATADTLGQAAAATGGIPSTAAVTAATQAGDYYATQLADKLPTLYQQAYERYLQEYSLDQSALGALQTQDSTEYGRLLDQVSYNTSQQATADAKAQTAQETTAATQQQKIENALNIWTTNGYATQEVADVLGVPVGTPTTDQSYNNWYTNYTQNKKSSASGGGSGGGADLTDAEKAFNGGDYSDSVIKALVAQGYTQAMIENAGYTGNYFGSGGGGETGGSAITGYEQLGTAAKSIAERLAKSYGSATEKVAMIDKAVSAGTITQAEAEFLLSSIGM